MSSISILIVEDEAIVALDLAGKIRQLGYDVAGTTASGEEAVELARGLRPALVLMDIRLAGAMDGIAAAELIQRECHLPVLFLTAHSDSGTVERARQTKAFGYILKPFDERDLHIQIEMALYKHAAERRLLESEERLRLLGNNLPDSAVFQYIHETDGSARFTYISEGLESLNGVSVAEVLRDADVLHRQIAPEYLARFLQAEGESARELSDFNMEVPMRRPDGELRWMQLNSRPRRNANGSVVWDGVQTDITERKRSEENLRQKQQALEQSRAELQAANSELLDSRRAALNMMEDALAAHRQAEEAAADLLREEAERKQAEAAMRLSEERYHSLFDTLLEGFCIIEVLFDAQECPVDYRFLEMNPAFEEQTGLRNAKGKLMRELAPQNEAYWFEIYGKVALTGEPARFVNEAKALNRWYDVSAYRVGGSDSRRVAILFNDISERKRVEEELQRAKETAEAATRVKSQFLANMSHELRTPMTGVLGMLDLALTGSLEAEQRESICMAHSSAHSLLRILNDILDMTKIEAGKLSVEEKPFSVRKCVEQTANILLPVARNKGIDLDFKVADAVAQTLVGDQTRLTQVLTNLVGNSVKFTGKGTVEIRVAAGERTPGGKREITFTVADTGIGIPADKTDLLFRFFSQVDESHSREYGGTGLGLAISKELVERMGGTIGLTSEEGRGSTFFFTIPFGEYVPETDAVLTPGVPAPDLEHPRAEATTKPLLLIAEDDQVIRKFLGSMLKMAKFDVDYAENGQMAVEMWEIGGFDLILMDVQMPRMNGFEATTSIREKERSCGGHVPIIAMTAHALKEDEQRCLDSGMDAYISKPINFAKTLQVIAENLKTGACNGK